MRVRLPDATRTRRAIRVPDGAAVEIAQRDGYAAFRLEPFVNLAMAAIEYA
jgi:hypothetical protein